MDYKHKYDTLCCPFCGAMNFYEQDREDYTCWYCRKEFSSSHPGLVKGQVKYLHRSNDSARTRKSIGEVVRDILRIQSVLDKEVEATEKDIDWIVIHRDISINPETGLFWKRVPWYIKMWKWFRGG